MARSNTVGKLRDIVEAAGDPKDQLWRNLGDLSGEEVQHAQVLVAMFAGSKYHPGTTLLRTDRDLMEQKFQGSVGMVVKMGPGAYKDDKMAQFYGVKLEVGDWVLFRQSDGLPLNIREVPCVLFEDVNIKMRVSDPSIYW